MMNYVSESLFRKIYYWAILAFLFVSPLTVAVTNIMFGVLFLLYLLSLFFPSNIENLFPEKGVHRIYFYASLLIFLVFIFASFMGANFWDSAETSFRNISFVIFPLYILRYRKMIAEKIYEIYMVFIAANLLAVIINLGYAAYRYFFNDENFSVFFYTEFSVLRRYVFFSIFITIALIFGFDLLSRKKFVMGNKQKWVVAFSALLFWGTVFLLSSRSGFLILLVVGVMLATYFVVYSKKLILKILMLLFPVLFVLLVFQSPRFNMVKRAVRSVSVLEKGTTSVKSDARFRIWESALFVIDENFYTGVGLDRVKSSLYEKHGIDSYSDLNTHNQFLNLFVASGFIGFLVLLYYFGLLIFFALYFRNFTLLLSIVTIFLALSFDTFLESSVGSFFIPFLFSLQVMLLPKEIRFKRLKKQ
ncbi:MAG: O-antigen ligase family protein [Bacteroidota bacterium]|nr:O-antigen ligase family protein [Bacteroidota bacterium]